MKLITNLKKNLPVLLIASTLVLILVVFIGAKNNSRVNKPLDLESKPINLKEFKSSNLNFSIQIPSEFSAQERSNSVEISSSNGKLYIDRNGTNFENLKDYLDDLDRRNKTIIVKDESLVINSYDSRIRLLEFSTGETQKEFVIFVDGIVYYLFTNDETLYNFLDQIAQSFRYTP